MKLNRVSIRNFRRFTNLVVQNIPQSTRLIMLAGPNGSGKSSFFDALSTWHQYVYRQAGNWDSDYHRKVSGNGNPNWSTDDVQVAFHESEPTDSRDRKKALYFRSAYRNEPEFMLRQLNRADGLLNTIRLSRMIENDTAVSKNYQRLASKAFSDAFEFAPGDTTLHQFREQTVGKIRDAFHRLFPDLELNSLGDPLTNGTFRFTKGASRGFLFKNLSGGEKAAFDLILDYVVALGEYDNTVFCIDEPETHMNTRLQAELLSGLFDLTPENCQLVLATHSIGMMRRASDIEKAHPGTVAFLDFGDRDFDVEQVIEPVHPTRSFWQSTYEVALDDLAALVAPSRVIICEGAPRTPRAGQNHSQDARCYDKIFEVEFPDVRFVSGGNVSDVASDKFVLATAIGILVSGVAVDRLIDRDDRSETEILEEKARGVRVLTRRNLESYLFDDEVLTALAVAVGKSDRLTELLGQKADLVSGSSGASNDLKPVRGPLYIACKKTLELSGCGNTVEAFMRDTLAHLLRPGMSTYAELRSDIFS